MKRHVFFTERLDWAANYQMYRDKASQLCVNTTAETAAPRLNYAESPSGDVPSTETYNMKQYLADINDCQLQSPRLECSSSKRVVMLLDLV